MSPPSNDTTLRPDKTAGNTTTTGGGVVELDPFTCIPKKNQKYASECTEVYLSNRGGTRISKQFKDFANVEVVWLDGNRLSRVENLEANFRIKEVYIQNNTLVSLAGLR